MIANIPYWVIIIILVLYRAIHAISRRLKPKGNVIESSLWRVGYAAIICIIAATLIQHGILHRFGHISKTTARGVWCLVLILIGLCLRVVDSPYVGQVKRFGRRSTYAIDAGITAIIPGVEELEAVSVENIDIEMGTSNPSDAGVRIFVVPTRDSNSLSESELKQGFDLTHIQDEKTPSKLPEKNDKGYNNLIIVTQVIYWTVNPKHFLFVNEGEEGVESRIARLIAARIRHYSVQVTDDFFINEKDAIAKKVFEDCTKNADLVKQIELLGQEIGAVNIRFADFQDQGIKNAQAQGKVQSAERRAQLIQAESLAQKVSYLLANIKDRNGQPVELSAELALDVLQAEDGNAIRIVGSASGGSASFGALSGQVQEQQRRRNERQKKNT